jgi:AcrR family transcriptional regulator
MSAATRIIACEGLGATTAAIANEAGVSNGSLFTYFETKTELFNQLYLELKTEIAAASFEGLPEQDDLRKRSFLVWSNWMGWATAYPEKRRALAQLAVSDEITATTREANGAMRNVPMDFVGSIMNSIAEATMDFMIHDKANAAKHCKVGFDAFWRAIG